MQKINIKILLFVVATVLILGSLIWFFIGKNSNLDLNQSDVFTIVDKSNNIVLIEDPKLSQDAINEYNRRTQVLINEFNVYKDDEEKLLYYYYDLGTYEKLLGNYKKSYNYYIKALEVDDEFRRTWIAMGDLMKEMNAPQSAEFAYRRSLELFNSDDLGYKALAEFYEDFYPEKIKEIRTIYEEGLAIIRNNTTDETALLKQYAEWLSKINDIEMAEKIYNELIEKNPKQADRYQRDISKMKK